LLMWRELRSFLVRVRLYGYLRLPKYAKFGVTPSARRVVALGVDAVPVVALARHHHQRV